jgi:hypothetical protein
VLNEGVVTLLVGQAFVREERRGSLFGREDGLE